MFQKLIARKAIVTKTDYIKSLKNNADTKFEKQVDEVEKSRKLNSNTPKMQTYHD